MQIKSCLTQKNSPGFLAGNLQGGDRVFLTQAGLVIDGNNLRLTATNPADLSLAIYPAPTSLAATGHNLQHQTDGVFQRFAPHAPRTIHCQATYASLQAADRREKFQSGKIAPAGVAAAPLDSDFEKAEGWRIKLLKLDLDLGTDPILRLHYVGDVARVTLNGRFITDDFYNGNAFDIGLRRHAPEILDGDLRIAILPLRKDAPILPGGTGASGFRPGSQRGCARGHRGYSPLPIATHGPLNRLPGSQVEARFTPAQKRNSQN